jgi:outer membrane lipoprotein-sorting protein
MKEVLFRKYIVLLFSGVSLLLLPYSVFPSEIEPQSESELSQVIKSIKEKEKSLKTFTARFVQNKKTHLLQQPLHSEGMIYFDHTGKMLLKVTRPSPLVLLLKDNLLLVYDPDLSKAKKRRLGKSDNIVKKYFGIGQSVEELKKRYEIQLASKTRSGTYQLRLIPKMKAIARHIDMIEVSVSPKNWLPEEIHFKESKGDHTSVRLEFTSINEPLPPGIFTIDVPEDDEDDSFNF